MLFKLWPKQSKLLIVKRDKINFFDTYAIGLYCKIKGKIEEQYLIGHLPREISQFCRFFLEYDGLLDAAVRATKFRRSPQGGLEILLKLRIREGKSSPEIFRKMKGFVLDNYVEPERIPLDIKVEEDEEDEFFSCT